MNRISRHAQKGSGESTAAEIFTLLPVAVIAGSLGLKLVRRRNVFLEILEQVRKKYRFILAGYVVMPEHFHLLMSGPEQGTPSTVVQCSNRGWLGDCAASGHGAIPTNKGSFQTTTIRETSGSPAFTISMSTAGKNTLRSCATCTTIR